jgi:hypothetical protein
MTAALWEETSWERWAGMEVDPNRVPLQLPAGPQMMWASKIEFEIKLT